MQKTLKRRTRDPTSQTTKGFAAQSRGSPGSPPHTDGNFAVPRVLGTLDQTKRRSHCGRSQPSLQLVVLWPRDKQAIKVKDIKEERKTGSPRVNKVSSGLHISLQLKAPSQPR